MEDKFQKIKIDENCRLIIEWKKNGVVLEIWRQFGNSQEENVWDLEKTFIINYSKNL